MTWYWIAWCSDKYVNDHSQVVWKILAFQFGQEIIFAEPQGLGVNNYSENWLGIFTLTTRSQSFLC